MARVMNTLQGVGLVLAAAVPLGAQDATPSPPAAMEQQSTAAPGPRPADRRELKHQIYVMEGALSRAVEFGAQQLNAELRSVMPDMFLLAGEARARGVFLEGYGIFFDVEVPMLRQSITWSLRTMMQQDISAIKAAAAEIRGFLQRETDPVRRSSLESALRQLESQATPVSQWTPVPGPMAVNEPMAAPPRPPAPAPQSAWLTDPNRAYTQAVQRALIDAMLDYSPPRAIGAEEWLTVAARDNEQRDTLAPPDPMQEVVTVLLKIKGADLMEYRSGKIEKEEARKRVRIGEF
jgi:hypothetical protein